MRLSAIVAMAANRGIGLNNQLPWRLPADLARFQRLTMGHTLVLGRKTDESIGRPLPGRTLIAVTRQPGYAPGGVKVAHSLDEALAQAHGDDEVFIGGGAELYAQAMERLFWLRPAMSVAQARALFVCTRAAVLPVIAGGFVLGAVTRADIERAHLRDNKR